MNENSNPVIAEEMSEKKLAVIPARIVLLREEKGWSQSILADMLTKESVDLGKNITVSSVSFWETGSRAVPRKYFPKLAKVLDTTIAYLCGLTDDVYGNDMSAKDTMDIYEIPFSHLYKYDRKPVFVEFCNYEHESDWGIYDKKRNRVIFVDYMLNNINAEKNPGLKFYTNPACYYPIASGEEKNKRPINMAEVLKSDIVYINMKTIDRFIQGKYNGWYQHNEDHTALINSRGLVLPYEGLNVSYAAYAMTE